MTRQAADRLIEMSNTLKPLSVTDSYVLDNGAGIGVLVDSLTKSFPNIRILATDYAPGMVQVLENKRVPNLSARVVDATELNNVSGLGVDNSFTHAFCTFVVMFSSKPLNVLQEMHRVLEPGGLIGMGIYGDVEPVDIWVEACRAVDPTYQPPASFADPNAWRYPREIEDALRYVGFNDVRSEKLKITVDYENSASYLHYWYESKHPECARYQDSWVGNQEDVKRAMGKVLRERYNDARTIKFETILTIGRKSV